MEMQKVHDSAHVSFILPLQSGQSSPFLRIVLQVTQKSVRISCFFCGSFRIKCVISSMSFCTSGTFSIDMRFPLPLLTYRLTADWDKPSMSAACCSFIPCFSTMVLAIRAFTAGKTVLTPTSHGNSIFSPILLMFTGNAYKYVACHHYMTRVITGSAASKSTLTTQLSTHTRQTTRQREESKNESNNSPPRKIGKKS